MQATYHSTVSDKTIIDENGSLNQFYSLTNQLSKTRHVRFLNKIDEADVIEWHFKYRGRLFTLQYNIYNGVSLYSQATRDAEKVQELAGKLRRTLV